MSVRVAGIGRGARVLALLASLSGACSDRARAEGAPPSAAGRGDTRGASAAPRRVTLTPEAIENANLVIETAGGRDFSPRISFPATLEGDPQQLARVGARVPGRVVALRVTMGDRVRVGDPLVEVDSVELHQVTTEYLVAVARDRQMQDALRRARALNAERVGPLQDVRRAEADAAAASAARHEAEEHLHFLGLRDADIGHLRDTTSHGRTHSVIRAPIEGTVSSLDVALGQVLTGSEQVAVVGRTAQLRATVHVYEREVARVSIGARVQLLGAGLREDEALEGTLSVLSDVLDRETRTAEGLVRIENPRGILRPGMALTALVSLAPEPGTLWLLPEAVQPVDGRPTVFVAIGERVFEPRSVRLGEEQGGRVRVLEGLRAGDRVVLRGAFSLRAELEKSELGGED